MNTCKAILFELDHQIMINAQIITDGMYVGIGRFCTTLEEAEEFAKLYSCESIEFALET